MSLLRKFSDLILYSSLWIAICAAAQVQLSYELIGLHQGINDYTLFVLASTLSLYCIHRLIGIPRVQAFEHEGRFAIIKKYKNHIIGFCILGLIGSIVFLMRLSYSTWLLLALPVLASAAYVIPVGSKGKRLRDFPFIKIFIIAISWSLITTTIPLLTINYDDINALALIFLERVFFVFAITVPFDIRDIEVDRSMGLSTLPLVIGEQKSKLLGIVLLIISAILTGVNYQQGIYSDAIDWQYLIFFGITAGLIWGARSGKNDYYFTGALDGTMLLLYFLIILF